MVSLIVAGAVICGCSMGKTMQTSSLFAMNTVMELEVLGDEELIRSAEDMIRTLEKELSVTDPESAIARLNKTGQAELTGEAATILQRALEVCDVTEGALDISIYPVLKSWGFTTGSYRIPDDDEIGELLKKVDFRKISLKSETSEEARGIKSGASSDDVTGGSDRICTVSLPEGMQIDLGSVVKGYTGSALAEYFRKEGVTSALINLGGNVECVGRKPSGEKWKVAVKSPFPDSSTGIIGVIEAEDEAIITSGGYERYFELGGKTYWHILDPKTGRPADSGLASVTIIGKDGLMCDGLSTALYVMGLEEAVNFWKAHNGFEAVFVTTEGEIYITEGISASFTLTPEYRDQPLTTISR